MKNAKLNLTLAVLKPSTVVRPHAVQDIINIIRGEGLFVINRRQLLLNKERASQFYREHEGKFFYNRLVTYMSSGPVIAMALAGTDVIQRWRNIMGPTKVYKTQYDSPSSIRGLYGISDTRNATHGSDSTHSAERELQFFFPDFDYKQWYRNEEEYFRQASSIYFDYKRGIHCCKSKAAK